MRYLADVAETVRDYHAATATAVAAARVRQHLRTARELVGAAVDEALADAEKALPAADAELLDGWAQTVKDYAGDELVVRVRDKELHTALTRETLSGSRIPRVALPRYTEDAELLRFLRRENLPGRFPFTAGVFGFKREGEDPARMFAGEGDAFRTNRRFKILSADSDAKRLSTAFDSVTLYGRDPDTRPDVYGKVGTSGVSIATLEDMKVLYGGFDLCSPTTSVSMTINGPAPTILAYYLNTAIDQRIDAFRDEEGREPDDAEREELAAYALANVRGTVQADILKEDQGQNTCIFSTEFSLRMMADIQEWFIAHKVRNFYSVSISGYHIAEAGANPISQLAFTLANGFTYVESYLARGMDIDDFAPNLSFFFSNGMDAEYSVIGRVARRIWAVAMRERYGANERSQKLKYHVQTSGRSLHAQEMDFNDIRTTLQALCALYDNANSLHTNAYDEAVTTPTEESVRRAMAIQMIINREWGLAMNENPLQGSFVIEELTDLVEEAVLAEFDRIAERGGVLGAMETGYQRGRIQDESMLYEQRKHDGSLPIIGVNTFVRPESDASPKEIELARATEAEKQSQLDRLARLPLPPRRRRPGRAAPPAGRRHRRRQRVRRADEGRAGVLARPAHRRVLRSGRPVPAQHVASRRVRRRRGAPGRDARSGATSGQHRAVAHRSRGAERPRAARRGHRLVHPSGRPRRHPRRGTKNPDVAAIVALAPDLVVANQEENRPDDLDALRAAGVPVYVTDIRTLDGAVDGAFGALARMLAACGITRPALARRRRARVGRRTRARPAPSGRACRSGDAPGWPSDATRSPAQCWPGSASTTRCATISNAIRASTRRRCLPTTSSSYPTSPTTSPPRMAPNPSPARSRCWSAADC